MIHTIPNSGHASTGQTGLGQLGNNIVPIPGTTAPAVGLSHVIFSPLVFAEPFEAPLILIL